MVKKLKAEGRIKMATAKKTTAKTAMVNETAKVNEKAEVKAEVKAAPAKVEKAPVKAAPAKVEKAPVKATAEKAEKAPAKKTTAKKAPVKKEVKVSMNVQFGGKSYTTEDLVKIAKDVWRYDLKQKAADFKSVELYVKPEDGMAYYVINGKEAGSFYI